MSNLGLVLVCFAFVFAIIYTFWAEVLGPVRVLGLMFVCLIAAQLFFGFAPLFR